MRIGRYSAAFVWAASALGVWLWTAGYGLTTYESPERFATDQWPRDSLIALAPNRPTLLFFMHPRCPCTRASVAELDKALVASREPPEQQARVIAVATIPLNASAEWRKTESIARISRLPGATMYFDVGGAEAARFGAVTSGTVMLYSPSGKRDFAGGITASRGHEGDNTGLVRLVSLLSGKDRSPQDSTPVFGCKLCSASASTETPCNSAPRAGGAVCQEVHPR